MQIKESNKRLGHHPSGRPRSWYGDSGLKKAQFEKMVKNLA
jgi:hypothetical protein